MSTAPGVRTRIDPQTSGEPRQPDADDGPQGIPWGDDGNAQEEGPLASTGAPLILEYEGRTQQVLPATLVSDEYCQQLRDQIRAGEDPLFDIRHLLDWADSERWAVLGFIAGLDSGYTVRNGEYGEPGELFVTVLAAMAGNEDVARCGRGVQAAVEAAVLLHRQPQTLPAACDRIFTRLDDMGVGGYTRHALQQQAEQLVGRTPVVPGEPPATILVRDVLAGPNVPGEVPASENTVVPRGWTLTAAGIAKGAAEEIVVPGPMLITRRFTDMDGAAEYLGVAWPRDGHWHQEVVPRAAIASSRTVIELAAYGAPVTSNNASLVVQYLADFEAYNLETLPRSQVARQLGWQGRDGRDGFLWGATLLYGGEATQPTITDMAPAGVAAPQIIFRGADEGDDQLADGFREAGTWEGWSAAVRPIGAFPRVLLGVYAALTPPVLEVLGSENFIVSYAGATSQGKTISLRIAASGWGCPDERATCAAIGTWDATRVWFGRAPAVMNHLPLVVDDTKRANDRSLIAQMIYDVASGRGRARGSKEGLARNEAFRTVMLTSGEAQITSFSQEGGTRARVLELWGSPFGRADAATAQIVNRVNDGVLDDYGHIGPRFVRFLIANRQCWSEWREQYRLLRQQFAERAGTNSVAARMAAHLAAIGMTITLVHQAVDMPWAHRDIVA
ncbi:MAG: DUF927 domain-containing protein [Thermoguttaceae bacterium]|jgi:hypothetical protein